MISHTSFLNVSLKDKTLIHRVFDVTTLKGLIKNIEKEASVNEELFKKTFKTKYNFIGDLFEIFAEIFFHIHSGDNRVGVFNYKPAPPDTDNGVDGFGIGIDGKPATVQVKFRSNLSDELKERDIKNFGFQSIILYDVDKNTKTNMVIFTTSNGLHYHTADQVFQGRMRTINGDMISKMIDNNQCFWLAAHQLINESIIKLEI